MSARRKSARGQPCDLMFPGIHVHDPDNETTILAHVRRKWNAGMRLKPPDEHGVYACFYCHQVLDRVDIPEHLSREDINQRVAYAVMRRNGVPADEEWSYILDAVLAKVIS